MRELKKYFFPNALFVFLGTSSFFLLLLLFSMNCLAHLPQACNLSQTNLFFVGREEQLQQIDSFFKKGDKIVFAITGGPGFGKTQIAKKYAHMYHKNYDFIWWIDAQQDIPSQFEKLALALNTFLPKTEQIIPSKLSKEVLIDTVKNILRLKKLRYLFVFDNPTTYSQVDKYIPTIHFPSYKHVLLTSRNANIWFDKIEIGKFKREESLSMITTAIPKAKKEEMAKLASTLSDYPLGLSLALSFIKSHPTVTIDKYITMHFKKPLKEGTENPNILLDRYPKDALATLEISLRSIEEESKDSLETLFFMSLLNSKNIPESYVEIWLKKRKSPLSADEAIKHVYDQSLVGISETTEFNVNKQLIGQGRMHYLSIHDLIHQLIGEQISVEEKRKLIDAAAAVMLDVFSGTSEVFTTKITKDPIHLLHAQKLCKNARAIGYSSTELLQLKACMFQCFMSGIRDFKAAQSIREDIEADLKAGIVLPPYYEALFKYNKGFLEAISARYDEAIQYMNEGLTLFEASEQFPGDHKNEILCALANLMQYYVMRGEIEKAELLGSKGQKMFQNSQSLVSNCSFLYAFSLVLIDQGKFQEAEDLLNKTKNYPTLSSERPPIYHGILLQKAAVLLKQKKLEEALKATAECKKTIEEFFQGKNNTSLSQILLLESFIEIGNNQVSMATLEKLEKTLSLFNDFFKGEKKQRRQANTYFAMGKAYALKKDYDERNHVI